MTGKKSETKKSRKRLASWENGSEPKNGKQRSPIEKLAPIRMIGTKNSEAKRSTKKMTPETNDWDPKNGKQKTPSEKVASKRNIGTQNAKNP